MHKRAPKQSKRLVLNLVVQKLEKDDQITYKLLDVSQQLTRDQSFLTLNKIELEMSEEETETTESEQLNLDLEKRRAIHQKLLQSAQAQMQKLLASKGEEGPEQSKQTTNSDTTKLADGHAIYESGALKEGQTLRDVEMHYRPYSWMNDF